MRKWKLWVVVVAAFFSVFTLFGFFILPPIVKSILINKLSENLHREVTIREIRVNPYALSLTVRGFQVRERNRPETFVSFEEIFVNLESISALKRALVLKEVRVRQPFINVARQAETTYNFSDLLGKQETKKDAASKPFRFSLNNITIENGSIDFWDGPKETKHTVRELNVGVPLLSNVPYYIDTFVQPMFSAKLNGTPYSLHGKTKIFADSRETDIDINVTDLNIPYYLAYIPTKLNFKILSALLDTHAKVSFLRQKNGPLSMTVTGQMALKNIAVDDAQGNRLLRLPLLEVGIESSEPLTKKIHLSKVLVQSPEMEVRRDRSGKANLEALFPPTKEVPRVSQTKEEEAALSLDIDEVHLAEGKVSFSDLSPSQPFKTLLKTVEVKVTPFSTRRDRKSVCAVSLKTEADEEIRFGGELFMDPFKGEGSVEVHRVPLKKYSPYYRDRIVFHVEEGSLSLTTRYRYARGEKELEFSLFDLATSLTSLRLRRPNEREDFLRIPLVSVKGTQIDLPKKEILVGEALTEKGSLFFTRLRNGELDLQGLVSPPPPERRQALQGKPATGEKEWTVRLARVLLDQYTVRMEDQKPSQPVTLLAEKIRLRGENISTAPNASGKVELSFLLDRNADISTTGTVTLDPVRIEGTLEAKQVSLKNYSPYYREHILFDMEDGVLGLSTNYQFKQTGKDMDLRLSGLGLNLDNLRLKKRDERENFLEVPALSVKGASVDLAKKEVSVGEFSTQKGTLLAKRSKDGKFSLQALFPSPPKAEEPAPAKGEAAEKPWLFNMDRFSLDQYAVRVEDEVPVEPVTLLADEIRLTGDSISTAKGQRGNVSLTLRLNQRGTLAATGPLGVQPLSADLKTSLKGIALQPLQPYIAEQAKIIVADGSLSTEGQLILNEQEGKGIQLTFKGNSSLSNFASSDKFSAEDLLRWESLALDDLNIGLNPLSVHMNGLTLTNFYARLILHPDGKLNLQQVFQKEGEKKQQAATSAMKKETLADKPQEAPVDIKIESVTLQGGEINFTDHFIKPNYSANMKELGGRISGLTSEQGKVGDVELRGKLANTAPLEINGKINPFTKDLFLDLEVKFKDIELGPMTPYSGKYAGYAIEKGKLTMDLKYRVARRKLDAQNRIFFDQLTLGDKVESPTATKLPVKLAIALLKDRKGEIRLDIPVSGSLDDPKFSVLRIVLQIVLNLLVKAATSPFALIGAMLGGGAEQLETMEFDYGISGIKGPSADKLNTLIRVLQERPSLKLDIAGHVDMEKDKEGLKKLFFDRKIKAQKLKEVAKKGQPSLPVDEINIEPAEYPKYLKLAYKEEKFPKPKNFLGIEKDIPVPEMEKLMLTHLEIKETDLRSLATQRSMKVKDTLVKSGKIEPERIFIVEPKSLAPEKKEKLKDSRVEFKIK